MCISLHALVYPWLCVLLWVCSHMSVHRLCMALDDWYTDTTNHWVHVSHLSDVNPFLTSGVVLRLKWQSNLAAPLKLLHLDCLHYFSSDYGFLAFRFSFFLRASPLIKLTLGLVLLLWHSEIVAMHHYNCKILSCIFLCNWSMQYTK